MDKFLFFLQNRQLNDWINRIRDRFGNELTDEEIVQSVQQACRFYNLNTQEEVWIDWITKKEFDDSFPVFEQKYLQNVCVSNKDIFDIILAYEGACCALKSLETNCNKYQEVLSCITNNCPMPFRVCYIKRQEEYFSSYMIGIRARVIGMNMQKITLLMDEFFKNSCSTSAMRIIAFEKGVAFASKYMEEIGNAPSFSICIERFEQLNLGNDFLSYDFEIEPCVYYGPPIPDDFLA